jgi:hypothetical protein
MFMRIHAVHLGVGRHSLEGLRQSSHLLPHEVSAVRSPHLAQAQQKKELMFFHRTVRLCTPPAHARFERMPIPLKSTPIPTTAKRLSAANPFNQTDAGNGSNGIYRVIDAFRSSPPDQKRSPQETGSSR